MKLTKEQFIRGVNTYAYMLEEESGILNVLNINPEWAPSNWINSYYDLLEDMCELEENSTFGTLLSWFCFETNFGKNNNIIKLTEESDGAIIEIKITNAADLYDYIITYEKEN